MNTTHHSLDEFNTFVQIFKSSAKNKSVVTCANLDEENKSIFVGTVVEFLGNALFSSTVFEKILKHKSFRTD